MSAPTDAVAQAREALVNLIQQSHFGPIETLATALGVEAQVGRGLKYGPVIADAVILAVRAECADRVRGVRWSEHSPFCDKSGVSGCCGMAARNAAVSDILAALEAK